MSAAVPEVVPAPRVAGVAADGEQFVLNAARVAGGRGDALMRVSHGEHERRAAAGIAAVTDLQVLDALLGLPLGMPVRSSDLSDRERVVLRSAPPGVVEASDGSVRRVLEAPVEVGLVVVRSARFREGLVRASAFAPFAQRVLLLPARPKRAADVLWEADAAGIGVWVGEPEDAEQLVAPAPWRRRYVKAAGWRFAEQAYGAWLSATGRSAAPRDSPDRRVREAGAGAGRQLPLVP